MNSRKAFLFIVLLGLSLGLYAQEVVVINKKEFRRTDQSEGFKAAWKSIVEGNKYYNERTGTINIARDHYLFANQYNAYNAELNYRIGICYLLSDEKESAIDYLLKAYELKPGVSEDVKLAIGRAYHYKLEFDEARQFYLEYSQDLLPGPESEEKRKRVEKLLIECTHGKTLSQDPKRVIIQNLGGEVNSAYDDYNPRFAYNDTALYFTSRRPREEKKSERSELDNKYYEDVYIASYSGNRLATSQLMGKPFAEKGNQSIVGVDPAGNSLFIYLGSEDGGDIQQIDYNHEKNKWAKPKSLSKYIGSDQEETTAALTRGGNEIYFVSANEKATLGGKDIFVSRLDPKGRWDKPINLGGVINSKYDEEGIYISNDGKTMYFSSKGHNSMGGFDIFKSEQGEDGTWGLPLNLGYPVNTPEDEVFYMTDQNGVYGFYSTVRSGGLGGKDIYKIIPLGSEKELVTLTKDNLIAGTDYPERNPFLSMPGLLALDTTLLLSGLVRDTIGGADTIILASLSFINLESGEVASKTMTGADGRYRARLPEPKTYGIEINASGYLYYLDLIDLSALNPDDPAEKDFFLQRLVVGTKVVLDNIYFETGKSILTVDSYEALNQVVRFLENNETVKLEISGHTDNTGSLRVNTNLSEARAKAVVDYLVAKGIGSGQLEYKGYADSQPVAPNDTPEGREMNRRVEFKVLSK